ncbi:hypothetical protein CEXT_791741 [Caerostris extrusa]|uniref:Uncharacterized protein n=1 Tax=Caerostris extrusa TaxID=172846 RepID=A0AAV4V8H3_CAEEX|nr:hypothetical protein CEXT_791741 [Caerostris extrusa]
MNIATRKTTLLIREAYTLYFNPPRDSISSSFLFLQSSSNLHTLFIYFPSIFIESPSPIHLPQSSSKKDVSSKSSILITAVVALLQRSGCNSMSPKDSNVIYLSYDDHH